MAPGSCPVGLPEVDIRMIDFAHSAYDRPDSSYILGLENLIQILQDIQEGQ